MLVHSYQAIYNTLILGVLRDGGCWLGKVSSPSPAVLRAKEKEQRSSIVYRSKNRENGRLIYREKTILGEAEYHHRSPRPSTSAGARPPARHGGRQGLWGLPATGLMPAAGGRWGCKHPNATEATEATGPNLMPTGRPRPLCCLFREISDGTVDITDAY